MKTFVHVMTVFCFTIMFASCAKMKTDARYLRTPKERFVNLPDYGFKAHFIEIDGLRVHYIDEGPAKGEIILLLHGEPSWSYLYRKIIPVLSEMGYRVIAPDFIGFGKSDKLTNRSDYTYQFHVDLLSSLIKKLNINDINLYAHDWGGLIGLRVIAMNPEIFKRVIACNTGLPDGGDLSEKLKVVRHNIVNNPNLDIGQIIQSGSLKTMSSDVIAAYNAPFPNEKYMAGVRAFPMLIPTRPDDPEAMKNKKVWSVLKTWKKPFLTIFSENDPISKNEDLRFQQNIPGAKGKAHVRIKNAGHFLPEDEGQKLAEIIDGFIKQTKY